MALAINIEELLRGQVIEWERLEFKRGWNPEDILHSLCAFANDINNWGGGYIIVGIEESNGRSVLPPVGLNPNHIDRIQGELTELCHLLQPHYLPIVQPYVFQRKHILVIYALAGDMRPYSAPAGLGKQSNKQRFFYIRTGSRTIRAQGASLGRLQELTARIPFDDRINQQSTIKDFQEKYFRGPLHVQLRNALDFIRATIIVEKVRKISGRAEADRFYNFPYEAIEEALANAVYHKSYELGAPIEVQIWPHCIEILSFPGPVPPVDGQILAENQRIVSREYRNRRVGDFLKELHLTEGRGTGIPTIKKVLLRNGSSEPIFKTDKQCISFLTILPAHTAFYNQRGNYDIKYDDDQISNIVNDQDKSKEYQSIKQITKISDQESNRDSNRDGNRDGNRECDQEGNYDGNLDKFGSKLLDVIEYCLEEKNREAIFNYIRLTGQTKNYKKYIVPALENNWIEMTLPEKPKSKNQKYKTTEKGKLFLKSKKKKY